MKWRIRYAPVKVKGSVSKEFYKELKARVGLCPKCQGDKLFVRRLAGWYCPHCDKASP